jgi:hypothetical protein
MTTSLVSLPIDVSIVSSLDGAITGRRLGLHPLGGAAINERNDSNNVAVSTELKL